MGTAARSTLPRSHPPSRSALTVALTVEPEAAGPVEPDLVAAAVERQPLLLDQAHLGQ
jgi:hypothetical protein